MCGIAGFLVSPNQAVTPSSLNAAASALAHRGPDDRGFLAWDGHGPVRVARAASDVGFGRSVGFVHQRLSILDLTASGWQPMSDPNERLFIVYNGEIYNFVELRSELEQAGHRFRSGSDTEVILAAWQQWGTDALRRFVGMFAFALLDVIARQVILARDSFGIKPLYWKQSEAGLAFASEIKALSAFIDEPLRANPRTIRDYLASGRSDAGTETMFAGISRLPAGHYAAISLDRQAEVRPVPFREWRAIGDGDGADSARAVRDRFMASVALHLRSDVPVGITLSGGIDSSAITAAVREIVGPKADVHAFSYVSDDPRHGEGPYAEAAASAARVIHHRVRLTADDLANDLDALIDSQDEPFASTSIYAQFAVYRAARAAGIKVVLDGQGADELLGGYPVFQAARLADLVRGGQLGAVCRLARGLGRPRLPWTIGRALAMLVPEPAVQAALTSVGRRSEPEWLDAEWLRSVGVPAPDHAAAGGADGFINLQTEALTQTSLPALLRYNDRNSMHFGVESRVPFLEPDLAELLLGLPAKALMGADGTTKQVFRDAMTGLVPGSILARRDKIGFVTPEQDWLMTRRGWVDDVLTSDRARSLPILRHDRVLAAWRSTRASRRPNRYLWRWINLARWSERFDVRYDEGGLS